jgi:hypothetical protein
LDERYQGGAKAVGLKQFMDWFQTVGFPHKTILPSEASSCKEADTNDAKSSEWAFVPLTAPFVKNYYRPDISSPLQACPLPLGTLTAGAVVRPFYHAFSSSIAQRHWQLQRNFVPFARP